MLKPFRMQVFARIFRQTASVLDAAGGFPALSPAPFPPTVAATHCLAGGTPMADFRRLLQSSALALGLAPLPALAESSFVYVTNSAGDAVDVVNASTDKVVQTFPIEGAHGINFSPDGSRVYVSNESTSTLDVFDQKTGKLLKKVTLSN